jgi:hypothetical protein
MFEQEFPRTQASTPREIASEMRLVEVSGSGSSPCRVFAGSEDGERVPVTHDRSEGLRGGADRLQEFSFEIFLAHEKLGGEWCDTDISASPSDDLDGTHDASIRTRIKKRREQKIPSERHAGTRIGSGSQQLRQLQQA